MTQAEDIRAQARAQWSHDPAGALAVADAELGTPESFAAVEAYRYRDQHWMDDTFRWDRFAGQRVLEIGVGLGSDHLRLARAGAQLAGIDLTPRCVDLTNRRLEQEGFPQDVEVGDAEQLPFPDGAFDAVYSFGVLHHVPSMERAFREVRRVLRPGGVFVGGLYHRHSFFYANVRLRRILSGRWRSETLAETHARIEYSRSEAVPNVRVLGRRELRRALHEAGFAHVDIACRHFGLRHAPPPRVADALARLGGWYLVHTAC